MGFLDRLFGGRAKTAEETRFPGEKMVVKAPMDGIVLPLEQLPDETFAAAILGPGCGIEPTGGTVYAPFDGKITSIVPTLHAVGDRKSTRLNSSHTAESRMPSSA